MANFAIVIGIDRYENPDFALRGAVADALRFAEWAGTAGGVPPDNVRLLLSPHEPVPAPHRPATSEAIRNALYEVSSGEAAGADRLFFYYAGHGLTSPGVEVGAPGEPVLVPSDMVVWNRDKNLLVLFSAVVTELRGVAPLEQFFFIDACRDLALQDTFRPVVGSLGVAWVPVRGGTPVVADQHIMYATSLGRRAAANARLNQGVFTPLLMDGLRGVSTALVWSTCEQQYEVRFSSLARHVKTAIRPRLAGMVGTEGFVQEPQVPMTGAEDAVLVAVPADQVPPVTVRIQVRPGAARDACTLTVASPQPGDAGERWTSGPPVEPTSVVELPPFDYTFRARAEGFGEAKISRAVYESMVIPFRLEGPPTVVPEDAPPAPGAGLPEGGPYAPGGADRPPPTLEGPGEEAPTTGRLNVHSPDHSAVIAVCDNENVQVAGGSGDVAAQLRPGLYRVGLVLPDGGGDKQLVEVEPGGTTSVVLDAPSPRLASGVARLLRNVGIQVDGRGYVRLARGTEPIARPSLASLLAFAAVAANGRSASAVDLLRFGVADVQDRSRPALVLLGSNREEGLPGGTELVVRDRAGHTLDSGPFEVLPAFPVAAQRVVDLPRDQVRLELRIPGHTPTRYAISPLPNRVAVLVVVLEADGRVEVQQYQLPGIRGGRRPRVDLRGLRRIELAQRYYSTGKPVPIREELVDLLHGKWVDPLLGCVAGYEFVRRGEAARFAEVALPNMLRHFPGLPDSQVLAGLCRPDRAGEYFERAVRLGVPTFSAGLVALYEWSRSTRRPLEPDLVDIATNLVPGSPWTAWAADRPRFPVHDGTFDVPAFGWDGLADAPRRLHDVVAAVCRVEPVDGGRWGTGFLVEPEVIATPLFVVADHLDDSGPRLSLGREVVVDFGGDNGGRYRVRDVVRVLPTYPEVVLLRVADGPARPKPLPFAPAPVPGTLVVVVGHPMVGPAAESRKLVMPGRLLGADATELRHDCTTGPGTAGSPLVHAATGSVIGMHYAAQLGERREGRAVRLSHL
ncbi:trypsin-like peptidase domain-containing protein [Saccharothrix variisporea]|uniref:V8-like Glu-specific endopeptidase n=1 Tax=Saccharothrix variisporea TaxID=543527 RepID=A0A495X2X6_9PSEU|nr:trypsin-like peptidase domain-containing protein [Saccharothrix variisporea]RKT67534.1 V8-like Glu-specific endopeptidase [Saccharothrix variisporea]